MPLLIYTLLIATFLERFGYFLIIPFLSIYLSKNFQFSGLQIGFVLSIFSITALFMSFIAAPYIDRLNKKLLVYLGLFLGAFSFLKFPYINSLSGFIIFAIINSVGNSLLSPIFKTLIAIFSDKSIKHIIFNFRYYIINIAATLAPLLSTQLKTFGISTICSFIVLCYVINLIGFTITFIKVDVHTQDKSHKPDTSIKECFKIFNKNRPFLFLIMGHTFFVFGYNLMFSILPQYFSMNISNYDSSQLFAFLLSINGVTVMTSQYLIFKFSKITSIKFSIILGSILLPIGLFLVGTLDNIILQSFSMIIFTLGEMLVFTMIDIRIDDLSDINSKGSYYSLSGLQNIGALLSPIIGGVLLDKISNNIELFGILSLISTSSIIFFIKSNNDNSDTKVFKL